MVFYRINSVTLVVKDMGPLSWSLPVMKGVFFIPLLSEKY